MIQLTKTAQREQPKPIKLNDFEMLKAEREGRDLAEISMNKFKKQIKKVFPKGI